MKVIYVGPYEGVEVPLPSGGALYAEHGQLLEVPDELGEGLLLQEDIWEPEGGRATKAPAPSDAVVKAAEKLGVDLATLKGTGKDGRIVVDDVKAAAEAAAAAQAGQAQDDKQPGEGSTEEVQ